MEFGSNLFLLVFTFLPGLFFVQGLYFFQRASVEYSDGLYEKIAYAIFFTLPIHLGAFWIAHHLSGYLFDRWQGGGAGFAQHWQHARQLVGLYADIAGLLFPDRNDAPPGDLADRIVAFAAYQVIAVLVALAAARIVSFLASNFSYGLPGLRHGVYSVINGFFPSELAASVLAKDPQHDGRYVVYAGLVDKVRMAKNGQIQHIYLRLPTKAVGRFRDGEDLGRNHLGQFRGKADTFRTGSPRLMDEHLLRRVLDESGTSGMAGYRLPVFFIDGADIANVLFMAQPKSEPDMRIRIFNGLTRTGRFVRDMPGLAGRSMHRLTGRGGRDRETG